MCSMRTAKRMIPWGWYSRQFVSFLILSTKTGKKILSKSVSNVILRRPAMTFEQCESHWYAYGWHVGKGCCLAFQRQKSTSWLLNRFHQTGNIADRPRTSWPHKTTLREDCFLMTSSRGNRFLSSRKLGRLLRNATCIRVCDRTVRNRLLAARLKAWRPYVGIPLTWQKYRTCCCTISWVFPT